MSSDLPLCSRTPSPGRETAEVRLDLPMDLVGALDGLAIYDGTNRTAVCTLAVKQYLESRLTGMANVLRMAGRSNPASADSERG